MKKISLGLWIGILLIGCGAPFWFGRSVGAWRASQKLPPRLIEVRADQAWQASGISIEAGDLLIVRYVSGLWSPWPGGAYDALGSGGDPLCTCNVLQGVSHAALIGKIGESEPFFVGGNFRHRMGEAGMLYFGINDNRLTDNSGALLVQVEIWR